MQALLPLPFTRQLKINKLLSSCDRRSIFFGNFTESLPLDGLVTLKLNYEFTSKFMLKKLFASVGIGAAKVDTCIFNEAVFPGEILEGEINICGGDVDQDIDDIYLKLATEYEREYENEGGESTAYEECVLVKYQLSERLTVHAREEITIPFELDLPWELPLTMGRTPVYIRTGLDIKQAINPRDRDELTVQPHPLMEAVFNGLEDLGFSLREAECKYAPGFGGNYPFIQEFEFKPTGGEYRQYLDEVEVVFQFLNPGELEVLLEIDRRARGLRGWFDEAFDLDERYVRFELRESELESIDVPGTLAEIIDSQL